MSSHPMLQKYTFDEEKRVKFIPERLLLGGGPPNYSPRVLASLCQPALSAICNELFLLMDEIQEMLKYVFQTSNEVTMALHCSGTGGLDAVLMNLIRPQEKILVCVNGYWGERIADMGVRQNLDVTRIDREPGEAFSLEEIEKAVITHKPVLLFMVQGDSCAGVLQRIEGLGDMCHKYNCLLAVDAIASLGCTPLFVDRWNIDVCVASSTKAMRGPPGLAYLTLSPKAVERLLKNKTKPSLYFDIIEIGKVWNCFGPRSIYHTTYNCHLLFAAKEALAEIIEVGLEVTWEKCRKHATRLYVEMEKIGFKPYVEEPKNRLFSVNTFHSHPKINALPLVEHILKTYQVKISSGVGCTWDKLLRIGLMGYNVRSDVVENILQIMEKSVEHFQKNDFASAGNVIEDSV